MKRTNLFCCRLHFPLNWAKYTGFSGRSMRANSDAKSWNFLLQKLELLLPFLSSEYNTSLQSPPTHQLLQSNYQGHIIPRIPLFLYLMRGHNCKRFTMRNPNYGVRVWVTECRSHIIWFLARTNQIHSSYPPLYPLLIPFSVPTSPQCLETLPIDRSLSGFLQHDDIGFIFA